MLIPAQTIDEEQRVKTLHSLAILDSEKERLFQDIVDLSSYVMKCPISLISLIDSDRQWFKARVGLDVSETHRDISFCGHAIHEDRVFIVKDALEDDRFRDNPLVVGSSHIRFYAGAPLITSDGYCIGTLCVLDRTPRAIDPERLGLLESLARQATFLIERRKNEMALEALRKNSQILFEKSPAIVTSMKGPEHIFDYANSAHKKLMQGVDAVGKPLLAVQPEASKTGFLKILDDVYQGGAARSIKNARFKVGKRRRDFNCFFSPSFGLDGRVDGVMGIIDDITDQRTLERKIKALNAQKEAKLEKMGELLERVPIAITLLQGSDHRVLFANQLYRSLFLNDRDPDDQTISELLPEAKKQGFLSILDRVFKTGQAYFGREAPFVRSLASGEKKLFYLNFVYEAARTAEGRITGVFAAISDVTEQVLSRSEVSKKVEALTEEREIRERFVLMLSHDLQSPLTAARIAAELVQRKATDPEKVRVLSSRIVKSIDRGERMVRDLLDANSIKAGEGIPINVVAGSFDHIVDCAVKEIKLTSQKDFQVRVESEKVPGFWDCSAIQRVVDNLLTNAVKYGDLSEAITVRASRAKKYVKLLVHNEGSVIPEEEQRTLFDSYRRAESALRGEEKGWGIGLTLVKGIAEAHGGSVRVDSRKGRGTTFYVLLPIDCRKKCEESFRREGCSIESG